MEGLLLVDLSEEPTCFHVDQLKKKITIDNIVFDEYEDNDYSGFYDWMRNPLGEIIGLRYTRLDGFEPIIITALKKLPYLNFTHEKIIEIYFNPNRDYVEDNSNDQDIGVCKMYVSANQTYAILLDILYLTPDEFSSIKLN
ncbi:MAG: hypothetical protein ABI113_14780 [Mucilaginibacter sp.]